MYLGFFNGRGPAYCHPRLRIPTMAGSLDHSLVSAVSAVSRTSVVEFGLASKMESLRTASLLRREKK